MKAEGLLFSECSGSTGPELPPRCRGVRSPDVRREGPGLAAAMAVCGSPCPADVVFKPILLDFPPGTWCPGWSVFCFPVQRVFTWRGKHSMWSPSNDLSWGVHSPFPRPGHGGLWLAEKRALRIF